LASFAEINFDNSWGHAAVIVYLLFCMLCVYFVMLGLLAELAVKASGMHRPRTSRILVTPLQR
jgi:hypothetical protein